MTKPASTIKKIRKQHSPEFRQEALKLAERIGIAATVRELSLYESQLYNWRNKQQQQFSSSDRENELAAENSRLRRRLAEQAEELAIRDILCEAPETKSVFIEKHQAEFSIKAMCRILRGARSGWYAWEQRRAGISSRQQFRLSCRA